MFPLSHDSAAATALAATMAVHSVIHFQNIGGMGRGKKDGVKESVTQKRNVRMQMKMDFGDLPNKKDVGHFLRAEIQLLKYVQM